MDTLAPPIPFSAEDEARRRLEHTIDQDLSSLSFTASTSFASGTSVSTIPVARSAHVIRPMSPDYPRYPSAAFAAGGDNTPRPKRAATSFAHTDFSEGVGASPTSTPGHHVSAATIGAGVFKRPGTSMRDCTGEEFDPDRSLGRLVGQLSKAMGEDRIGPKPVSPFVSPRSPHSPSPAPSTLPNLSFQLTRNEPPLSPPQSRTVSASSGGGTQRQRSVTPPMNGNGGYTASAAAANGGIRATQPGRPVLGETGRHNWSQPPPPHVPAAAKDKGWMKAPTIVPVVVNSRPNNNTLNITSADITGITGLLSTPAKGAQFEDLNKNGADVGPVGVNVDQGLATLQARLRALETENGVSRRRVNELEAEVARARQEVVNASSQHDGRLREVMGEKTALEELVSSLRENLKRLTIELEENKALVSKLRMAAQRPPSPIRYNDSVRDDVRELRREVERLSQEVVKLNQIAEAGLAERTRARENRSMRINALDLHDQDEVDRVRADVNRRAVDFASPLPSQLRQGLHTAAAADPKLMPPSAGPTTRFAPEANTSELARDAPASPSPSTRARNLHPVVTVASPTQSIHSVRSNHSAHTAHSADSLRSISTTSSGRRRRKERKDGPDSPFPSIRAEDEVEFFSPGRAAAQQLPPVRPPSRMSRHPAAMDASRTSRNASRSVHDSFDARDASRIDTNIAANETVRAILTEANVPPQTVLARVIHELEDDFAHYKQIYCELADQYKVLDAASVAAKRHVLAEHLKEVIDTLEQKADQIAALYSLLHYQDRAVSPTARSSRSKSSSKPKSARDLWRAVRESLPEDARRRLEADGLFRD